MHDQGSNHEGRQELTEEEATQTGLCHAQACEPPPVHTYLEDVLLRVEIKDTTTNVDLNWGQLRNLLALNLSMTRQGNTGGTGISVQRTCHVSKG
jgi:hypothetical protein